MFFLPRYPRGCFSKLKEIPPLPTKNVGRGGMATMGIRIKNHKSFIAAKAHCHWRIKNCFTDFSKYLPLFLREDRGEFKQAKSGKQFAFRVTVTTFLNIYQHKKRFFHSEWCWEIEFRSYKSTCHIESPKGCLSAFGGRYPRSGFVKI